MKQKGLLRTIVEDMSENTSDSANYFKGVFPLYIHKKLRRLAEAIYLVTNHFSGDPLKNLIRGEIGKIVNLSVKIKGDNFSETSSVFYEEIITGIAGVISLLEISAIAGMISEANYYLINKELNIVFKNLTDKIKDRLSSNEFLAPSFFAVELDGNTALEGAQKDKNIKDKEMITGKDILSIKDNITDEKKIKTEILKNNVTSSNIIRENKSKKILRTVEKLDREKMILGFFKDNKKMTIKDISVILPQFSEKTIQREILRLVSAGVLSKSGKKRWTLYFLS